MIAGAFSWMRLGCFELPRTYESESSETVSSKTLLEKTKP
jgi:hypothetical protein